MVVNKNGSRRFRLPDFHDIRHMKVVRLSASRTGRLYPQDINKLQVLLVKYRLKCLSILHEGRMNIGYSISLWLFCVGFGRRNLRQNCVTLAEAVGFGNMLEAHVSSCSSHKDLEINCEKVNAGEYRVCLNFKLIEGQIYDRNINM